MSLSKINHTQIPNKYLDEFMSKHNGSALKCFMTICRKTIGWHKDTDKISYSQFQKLTGLGSQAIREGLTILKDDELISIEGGNGKTNTYEINYNPFENQRGNESDLFENQSATSLKIKDTKESNINKNINKLPFDQFWSLYDYKKCKVKCEPKWYKLSLEEQKAILSYLPQYLESTPDKKYRKHPSTFFNQRAWEDEITHSNSETEELLRQTDEIMKETDEILKN